MILKQIWAEGRHVAAAHCMWLKSCGHRKEQQLTLPSLSLLFFRLVSQLQCEFEYYVRKIFSITVIFSLLCVKIGFFHKFSIKDMRFQKKWIWNYKSNFLLSDRILIKLDNTLQFSYLNFMNDLAQTPQQINVIRFFCGCAKLSSEKFLPVVLITCSDTFSLRIKMFQSYFILREKQHFCY